MPEGPEQYTPPEIQKGISLRDLLTYANPKLAEYQELIKRESSSLSAPRRLSPRTFSEFWKSEFYDAEDVKENKRPPGWQKLGRYLKEKLQAGILIDVGGGRADYMRDLADLVGVQRYINVDIQNGGLPDPYTAYPAPPRKFWRLSGEERTQPMEAMHVTSDMLDFVARLPSDSNNFSVNGIDDDIVQTAKYANALFQELVRATKIGGILFGIGTTMWQTDTRLRSVAKELDLISQNRVIFEKIKE